MADFSGTEGVESTQNDLHGQHVHIRVSWHHFDDRHFRVRANAQWATRIRKRISRTIRRFSTLHICSGASREPKSTNTKYRSLLYKNDVRILVLHPSRHPYDAIHYSLEYIYLENDHKEFEALSYTWGDPTPVRIVYDSGEPVRIPENLFSSLRALRYSETDRVLWVDSLCIDQSDADERGQQVRLMGDVFSEANRVIVWLGEETPDVQVAFKTLSNIHFDSWNQKRSVRYPPLWVQVPGQPILRTVNGTYLHRIDWQPVKNLLHRPWFHRMWVYQEVANANRVVVVCGKRMIPWSKVSGALEYLIHHGLASKFLDLQSTYACIHVTAMEKARRQSFREPLFNVVLASSYGGCSNPRDKIFAVMSIADGKDIFDWEISFNYSLSVSDFFKTFAIWDIYRGDSLRSLSCATAAASKSRLLSTTPSWVPDWTQLRTSNLFVRWNNTTGFCAADGTEKEFWFTHDQSMLHVKGADIDYIEVIGSTPRFVRFTSLIELNRNVVRQLELTDEWIRECWSIAASTQHMTVQRYDAFWRTMICDLTADGHKSSRSYSDYFLKYRKFLREAPVVIPHYLHGDQPIAECSFGLFANIDRWMGYSPPDPRSLAFHEWINRNYKTNAFIEASLEMWASHRRFCRTGDGRLAQVPEHAAVSDSVCILHGSQVPYVLRRQEDGTYVVIGECYVHGIMHGEALALPSYEPKILKIR
jgi:hypothetical protein